MTPIKFPHQQFLEDNKEIIAKHRLPELLQKRIVGFEDLQQNLSDTTDEDYSKLLSRMERLSYELDEDLEEYFEEYLENNNAEEDDPELPDAHADQQRPDTATSGQEKSTLDIPPDVQGLHESPLKEKVMNREHAPAKASEASDEDILDMVVKDRMATISPSELFKRGFKGLLGARTVFVGKYCLRRGKYETAYRISLHGA